MFRSANLTPIFLTSPSSTKFSMTPHVSWNGVFSHGMSKRNDSPKKEKILKRTKVNLPIVPPPLRGISMIRLNVCQSDWEMHQEEIEIVKTPKIELHPCSSFYLTTALSASQLYIRRGMPHMLLRVESVPELRSRIRIRISSSERYLPHLGRNDY
jgi:hypothetical protein